MQKDNNKNNQDSIDNDSNLLVNVILASKITLTDIRMLILDSNSKVKLRKSAFKFKVVINKETYRKVSTHVVYFLSKLSRLSDNLLVDRRAHDAIASNDVSIIFKYPNKSDNIRGINDYEITSIPLVTTRGFISTIFWRDYCYYVLICISPQMQNYVFFD